MRDPLRQLRELPWAATFSAAGLTVLGIAVVEAVIAFGLESQEILQPVFQVLFGGPLGQIVLLLMAALAGALSLMLFIRLYRWFRPSIALLWALVASMVLVLLLRSLFSSFIPMSLTRTDFTYAVGIAIGTFWKGKPYW